MSSLFTVNNNFSLISISIAPSTFLAGFALFLVFLSFYITHLLPAGILRRISSTITSQLPNITALAAPSPGPDKNLPALPYSYGDHTQLVLQDQSLTERSSSSSRSTSAPNSSWKTRTTSAMADHIDDLDDVYLQGLEASLSPVSLNHSLMTAGDSEEEEAAAEELDDNRSLQHGSETASGNGFFPPAWRNLQNGELNRGFASPQHNDFRVLHQSSFTDRLNSPEFEGLDEHHDHVQDLPEDHESVLAQAIRTKLPRGSMSPEKGRSPSPERRDDTTVKVQPFGSHPYFEQHRQRHGQHSLSTGEVVRAGEAVQPIDNYLRFAVNAEILQRTAPIEAVINWISRQWNWISSSKTTFIGSLLTLLIAYSFLNGLAKPAAPRPAGDLVKVAGLAKSFEPLVFYSEHAVAQVHELQATSVAVWDLGESVRSSDMGDAATIVNDLDALSESMKTLGLEMTKFLTRVDGDIDDILNVMEWAKMHLNRLNNLPPPSTLTSAYDNIHESLTRMHILEDASGSPTPLGTITTYVFGMSNPQREQRMVQLLFNEFLTVLEESIQAELQQSVKLFALFEAVDYHFLNLARTVVRESTAQEEMHADLLSSMWTRMLGARAGELRKFEQNRQLLRNVRDKTVRNKGVLQDHNGRLLGLKASLESLRTKLVSPLVRGQNSTTLTLEDQIHGISVVSDRLGEVRAQQKSKVMEILFAAPPNKAYMIDSTHDAGGQTN
ncbi:hypothetical protein S7711_09918 [Stachybotrys chartarum IBT 7711]|uniref:Uncharacterized protein n=1 Tax=Stachybotrys chartarum (strain CBS 109288 / IBT 7711) TaxID=1280523 RepID=A0A084AG29_STACB|nr:hypothetical protein S7711_09918 [Stachybotrys chartarum IBT 7711]